jgi:hypothetical protein
MRKYTQITIYREDMNNRLHGNMFNGLLEDLGINTTVVVNGKAIEREIDEITLSVVCNDGYDFYDPNEDDS